MDACYGRRDGHPHQEGTVRQTAHGAPRPAPSSRAPTSRKRRPCPSSPMAPTPSPRRQGPPAPPPTRSTMDPMLPATGPRPEMPSPKAGVKKPCKSIPTFCPQPLPHPLTDPVGPVTIQPFRAEMDRVIAAYIMDGAPRQLNLSSREQKAALQALSHTTHPARSARRPRRPRRRCGSTRTPTSSAGPSAMATRRAWSLRVGSASL